MRSRWTIRLLLLLWFALNLAPNAHAFTAKTASEIFCETPQLVPGVEHGQPLENNRENDLVQLRPTSGDTFARFYNPASGRFWTADSWEGNQSSPLTLNKYLYTEGNPINMVDPSGHFGVAGTMSVASIGTSIRSMHMEGVVGVGEAMRNSIVGAFTGKEANEVFSEFMFNATVGVGIGVGIGAAAGTVGALLKIAGNFSKGQGRVLTRNIATMQRTRLGRVAGKRMSSQTIAALNQRLAQYNVKIWENSDLVLDRMNRKPAAAFSFEPGAGEIFVRSDVTRYELFHEIRHALDWAKEGHQGYKALGKAEQEKRVYDWLVKQDWMTENELAHAYLAFRDALP